MVWVSQTHHHQLDQKLFDYDVVKELEMNPKAMHRQDCLHRVRMMSSPWWFWLGIVLRGELVNGVLVSPLYMTTSQANSCVRLNAG